MTFEIRNFTEEEFQKVRDWTAAEHWNPGIYDFLAFKTIDRQGFWVGVLDGQPITSVAAVQYDENFAYVGLYFTKPQFRGKGYGIKVWKKALSRLTAKNIGLQSIPEQQMKYQKSGFKSYHKILRQEFYGLQQDKLSSNLLECRNVDFEKLLKFDRENFFAERRVFLQKWINLPESKSSVYVEDQEIKGYGVLRLTAQGFTVGPLYANSYQIASQILKGLRSFVPVNKKMFINIPDINQNAMKLSKELGMYSDQFYMRMYTNGEPEIGMSKTVYGITCCEFG